MTSGPSTFAVLSLGRTGRSTSTALQQLVGLNDPDCARAENKQCLTALYGTDQLMNGFFVSANNDQALK
jgi:hypothetical protein